MGSLQMIRNKQEHAKGKDNVLNGTAKEGGSESSGSQESGMGNGIALSLHCVSQRNYKTGGGYYANLGIRRIICL
jgi:hypothetical protein